MMILVSLLAAAAFVVGMIAILAVEQRDKEKRAEQGLPPKKYGDITDQDVTIVYSIRRKRD